MFVLFAVPILVIAVYLFVRVMSANKKSKQAMNHWTRVTGRVLASSIEARTSTNGDGHRSTSYYPNVLYEYAVNGQRYQNNRITFGMDVGYGNRARVEQDVAQKYPVGGAIQVYYDPQDATQSVLELKLPASKWVWLIIFALVFTLICTGVFMVGMGSFMDTLMNFVNQVMPK